jgi:hypothetical protein
LFAHFGGDPSSASPADIAHFHTQLTGAISGSISPGATALQTGASGGKEPVKMQSGGLVPEIPRGLLGGGITPKTQSKYYSDSSQADPQGTQPDRPRREVSGSSTGGQTSAQDYADWANQGGLGGSAGAVRDAQGNLVTSSGALTAQAGAGAGATMMPGGGIRDASGNVYDSSANLAAQDVGGASATMPGAGGAGAGAAGASGAASAIGSIGSAVAKAAQTYADSIKGWQMQKSAIPNPDDFRKQPQINLQQPGVV